MNTDRFASVDDFLRCWARVIPSHDFIVCGGDAVTYAEADAWVDRVAVYLSSAGINVGDRVGVVGPNSLEWIVASLAIFRVGAVQTGLFDRFLEQELSHAAAVTGMRAVFTADSHVERMRSVAQQFSDLKILPMSDVIGRRTGDRERFEKPPVDAHQVAAIVLSSGSTGLPKGIAVTMNSILSVAEEFVLIDYQGYGRHSRNLQPLPLAPMGGFISKVVRALVGGGTCFVMRKFDEREALRLLVDEKCNSLMAAPQIFQRISALPEFEQSDLSTLTHAGIGGAPVPLDEFDKWLARGAVLRQAWGSTETGTFPAVTAIETVRADPSICGVASIFRKIKIEHDDGTPCAPDESGEIWVSGPGVTQGYWKDEKATEAAFRDGWYRTGDLGQFDKKGVLRIVGRLKEIIITGGYNVGPFEVERAIEELDWVVEAAVIGVPDRRWGEGVGAIVRVNGEGSVDDIVSHCRARLAGFKVPRYVLITREPLPRTENKGNLAKGEIKERFGEGLSAAAVVSGQGVPAGA